MGCYLLAGTVPSDLHEATRCLANSKYSIEIGRTNEHPAPDLCPILTREQGADLFPAGDAPFRGVLAYDYLQEKHRQAAPKQENKIRYEEGTCGESRAG